MSCWNRVVEEKIQKAMEAGAFDNLPGTGQPLQFEETGFEDSEMWLANHLLEVNNLAPAWVEERKEIETSIRGIREGLARSWRWYCTAEPGHLREDEWRRRLAACQRQIEQLNRRIFNYNLITPTPAAHRLLVDTEQELQRAKELYDS